MNDDANLVERAVAGDREAFAELYELYFDRVFDFLARMVRDQQQAADLAQDTFLRAMHSLSSLTKGASFKSWIFTIARNTALNQIERSKRTQPLESGEDDDDGFALDVVDTDRLGNPEEAVEVKGYAALVWDAAKALDPKQYSVLDLTVRQGLESAEIAEVLGVSKNNAYVMVNRMKKTLEEAIGALLLFREGRRQCAELNRVLVALGVPEMSVDARKAIDKHASRCDICSEQRQKLASPFAILGGFAVAQPALGIKVRILDNLQASYPYSPGSGSGGSSSNSPGGNSGLIQPRRMPAPNQSPSSEGSGDDSKGRRLVLATTAAGLLLLLGGLVGVRAFGNGSDTPAPIALNLQASPTPLPTILAVAPDQTATPSPAEPTETPTETPAQEPQPAVGPVPPTPSTPVPVQPGPNQPPLAPNPGGGGGNNPPAGSTGGSIVSPPDPPPAPPAQCVATAPTALPASLDFGLTEVSKTFELRAAETCGAAMAYQTQPGTGWVNVASAGSGALQPGGRVTITVRIDRAELVTGINTSRVRIITSAGSIDIQVSARRAAPTPTPTRTRTPTSGGGQFAPQPTATCSSSSITCN